MKKLIILAAALFAISPCFAYLEEGHTADVSRMQKMDYSQACLKIIDRETSHARGEGQGINTYYKPYEPKNKLTAFYHKLKVYIDPAQEDYDFGHRENSFTNGLFEMNEDYTKYSTPSVQKEVYVEENL